MNAVSGLSIWATMAAFSTFLLFEHGAALAKVGSLPTCGGAAAGSQRFRTVPSRQMTAASPS